MKIKKEQYNEFALWGPLAIESYCDVNELDDETKKIVEDMYSQNKRYIETTKKMIEERDMLVDKLIEAIDKLGIDNFTLYEDGDIVYNY